MIGGLITLVCICLISNFHTMFATGTPVGHAYQNSVSIINKRCAAPIFTRIASFIYV